MMQIVHTPWGQEHPYEQLPEERFPRQPLAGEVFTVGVAVRPPAAAERVQVWYRVGTGEARTVDAERDANWQPELEHGVGAEYLERLVRVEQDVWQARLTAPAVGQTLTYWIEADGETSAEYTLTGEGWQTGGGLVVDEDAQTLHVSSGLGQATHTLPQGLPRLEQIEWLTDGTRPRRVRLTFACQPDEAFFGLGERFNALNQRGNVVDVRVYEQYKSQGKRTYLPIPFLLSSQGYGLWVDSTRWMQFDLASSAPQAWTLEADVGQDSELHIRWFNGDDPLEIIRQFTQATGPATLPPLWTFGLWMSANEWNSQARVMEEFCATLEHGIPASVLVIEAWSDETTFYIWNDAEYTPTPGEGTLRYSDFTFPKAGRWPNPQAMVDDLHKHGTRLVLWQIPVLKALEGQHPQHEADRAYFEQSGFGVHEPDGSLYRVRPFWFRNGYLWDVTNPQERAWWLRKRAYLLDDMGVDGFKTDGGEHLWSTQVRFADGRTGAEVWNEYPRLYTEAYYQFATERRNGDAVLFSRAGFTGSQRGPAHWAGDENSTWDAFRHSILAGLSAGISGIPFWGWDIGGFSGPIPTAELYLRGTAMAAFCPIMQYHSEYNPKGDPKQDRTPWNMQARTGDERIIPVFRWFVNVRHNLMPYIWQEAQHSARTGEPMMRALGLWEREASPYAYYFGRDLLVFPVVEQEAEAWDCALPAGAWYDLWTGERYDGNQTHNLPAPIDRIPVFVRAGARIPVRLGEHETLGGAVPLSGEPDRWLSFPIE